MTNALAVWLGIVILIAFGLDWLLFDWSYTVVIMRKFTDLISYLAFWR